MKTRFLLLIPVFALLSFKQGNQPFKKDEPFSERITGLQISSFLTYDGKKVTDYSIIIYHDAGPNDTVTMSNRKNVSLLLDYNHNYTLDYVKEGYRDRLVLIDTHVKSGVEKKNLSFDYEIEMVKQNEKSNTIDDLPVALISYDANQSKFDYSRKYHNQVRGKKY